MIESKFARTPGQPAPSLEDLHYDERGLIPCVLTHADTGRTLRLAHMNREALGRTIVTGRVHLWNEARAGILLEGEAGGSYLDVVRIHLDCTSDALWAQVRPSGPVCLTGEPSCFFTELYRSPGEPAPSIEAAEYVHALLQLLAMRNVERPEDSHTAELFAAGADAIVARIDELATEVGVAARARNTEALQRALADLVFHGLVLCVNQGIDPYAIVTDLRAPRR